MKEKLNILLVDDHYLFRNGLKLLLKNYDIINNIHEASTGEESISLIEKKEIDIILMDISMPGMDGIETTEVITSKYPGTRIIALSMFGDEEYYYKMINAGVKGFLVKDSHIDVVLEAIKEVAGNKTYFSQEILCKLVKSKYEFEDKLLTNRETEILGYICKGYSNQQIAGKLHLSKRTVDKHRENILSKTNSKNTASLIMFAIKNKLI